MYSHYTEKKLTSIGHVLVKVHGSKVHSLIIRLEAVERREVE